LIGSGDTSAMSAVPAPVEHAAVDYVYFQNGLLKANISWTVNNGDSCFVSRHYLTSVYKYINNELYQSQLDFLVEYWYDIFLNQSLA